MKHDDELRGAQLCGAGLVVLMKAVLVKLNLKAALLVYEGGAGVAEGGAGKGGAGI